MKQLPVQPAGSQPTQTDPPSLSLSRAILKIPNLITSSRILAIPAILFLLYGEHSKKNELWAGIVFGVALFTDIFDGIIARRTKAITRLGRVMDPLADKLIVLAALLLLVKMDRVNVIVAIVLLSREITVSGLRGLAGDDGIVIPSRFSGKAKTALEGFALGFLIGGTELHIFGFQLAEIGGWLLYVALATALWSAAFYFRDYFRSAHKLNA